MKSTAIQRTTSIFQCHLDANVLVDESELDAKEKELEKEAILITRKDAFGEAFIYYPPWRK